MKITVAIIVLMCALLSLSACAPHGGNGTLVLQITDQPAGLNIQKALVTISEVKVHKAGIEDNTTIENNTALPDEAGWITVVQEQKTFDLVALKDVKQFLGSANLSSGKYTQLRLNVDKAVATIDGQEYDLTIPSRTIKLITPFTIAGGRNTILTLDFNAAESVHQTGKGKYSMRPTIKVSPE